MTQTKNELLTEDYMRGYFEEYIELVEAIENGNDDIFEKLDEVFIEIKPGAAIMCTGGPHIELCFNCGTLEAYWGRERFTWHLNRSQVYPFYDFLKDCEVIS